VKQSEAKRHSAARQQPTLAGSLEDPSQPSLGEETSAGTSRPGQRQPTWKRVLDLAVLGLCAPILLPVFAVVTSWIKLTSKGPVLFRQDRVGQGERLFTLCKFRSMRVNADTSAHEFHLEQLVKSDGPMIKLDALGDSRLIPGGHLLRASGLDELPQIFNVLRGEMSLVGPRPCTLKEAQLYRKDQKKRFQVLPGLTGYWQVHGKNRTTFTEMVALDDFYVDHRSLLLDVGVILRTPLVLLAQISRSLKLKLQPSNERSAQPTSAVHSNGKN